MGRIKYRLGSTYTDYFVRCNYRKLLCKSLVPTVCRPLPSHSYSHTLSYVCPSDQKALYQMYQIAMSKGLDTLNEKIIQKTPTCELLASKPAIVFS